MTNRNVYIFDQVEYAIAFDAIARWRGCDVSRIGSVLIMAEVDYHDTLELGHSVGIPAALVTAEPDDGRVKAALDDEGCLVDASKPARCAECERQYSQVKRLADFAHQVIDAHKAVIECGHSGVALSNLAERAQSLLDDIDQENGND